MSAFAGALQGLGGVAGDIAQGRQTFQDWRTQQAFNQLALKENALKLAQMQSQLKQAGQPQLEGTGTDPNTGATFGLIRDPVSGQIRTQVLIPGVDPSKVEQTIASLPPNLQNIGRQTYQLYGLSGFQKFMEKYTGEVMKPAKPQAEGAGTQAGQYTTADKKSGWGYRDAKTGAIFDAATGQQVEAVRFVPSSMLPTPGVTIQSVQGPGGSTQLMAIPESKSKGGGISLGQPIPIGQKALPAGAAEKLESMVSTVKPVLEAMQRMRDNADVLANPASAAKIGMATSSNGLAAFGSRFTPMTDQEKQYAADYVTTAEGVNAIRTALQATGFRGPYAWEALLAQRGNLLGRPDVTRSVLDQSIKILQGQLGQALNMLGEKEGGSSIAPATLNIGDVVDGYRYMGGDPNSESSYKRVSK